MKHAITILKFVAALLIVAALIGLWWWYVFLRGQQQVIARSDAGRGAGLQAPSFSNTTGSTYNNIVSAITSQGAQSASGTRGQLVHINTTPTAGMGFITASSTTLRFVERSTGYVFDVNPENGSLTRLTNTLIPRVYEALVARDGRVVERTYDNGEVITIAGDVLSATSSGPGMLRTGRLPDNIFSIAVDPKGNEVFYIVARGSDIVGIRTAWDGSKPKTALATGISGWHVRWLSDGRLILTQKASDGADGYAYELKDGTLVPIAHGFGLTTLPRASSPALIYGQSSGSSLTLTGMLGGKTSPVTLPVRTIADKCVWSPSKQLIVFCAVPIRTPGSDFLNRWYRGETHTADSWWRIDVSAGSAALLYAPGDIALDVENPVIDDTGTYIAFMNAIDKSLWLLRTAAQ